MRNRRSFAIALALCASLGMPACRTRLVPYAARPPLMERDQAIRAIAEVVERQPPAFAPSIVEVTDEKLAVTWRNQRTVFYYDRISELNIYKDRRGNYYFVRIRDSGSEQLLRVWTPELLAAQLLVDGLWSMRAHAREGARDPERQRAQRRLEKLRKIREDTEEVRREQEAERQRKELELEAQEPSGTE